MLISRSFGGYYYLLKFSGLPQEMCTHFGKAQMSSKVRSIDKLYLLDRLDLFKSPSEKRYELTIICQYECSEFRSFGLPCSPTALTLGLCYAHIDILSSTHVFFSDGDLSKSMDGQKFVT